MEGLLGRPPEALSTRPRLLTQASHRGDSTRPRPGQGGERVTAQQWVRNKAWGQGAGDLG